MNLYTLPLWAKFLITVLLVVFLEPYGVLVAVIFWGLILKGKKDLQAENLRDENLRADSCQAANNLHTANSGCFMSSTGYSTSALIPLLAYYMFVQSGAASNIHDALEQLSQMDGDDFQSHMAEMLQDQHFMDEMMADPQLIDSLHNESLHLQDYFTDLHHLDELARIAAEESMKAVTPVEHGGYNMEYGNTFNDIGAGGLQDFHHVTDPNHDFDGHDFDDHDYDGHDFDGHDFDDHDFDDPDFDDPDFDDPDFDGHDFDDYDFDDHDFASHDHFDYHDTFDDNNFGGMF